MTAVCLDGFTDTKFLIHIVWKKAMGEKTRDEARTYLGLHIPAQNMTRN